MNLDECFDRTWRGRGRLLDACDGLAREEWTRDLRVSWGSLRTLFAHVIEVERSWVGEDILRQTLEPLPEDFLDSLYGTVTQVRHRGAEVAAETRAVLKVYGAGRLGEAREVPRKSGGVTRYTVDQILTHVFTHEIRHHGQLQAMLRLLGKPAPALDWL